MDTASITKARYRARALQLRIFRMDDQDPRRNRLIMKMNRFEQFARHAELAALETS